MPVARFVEVLDRAQEVLHRRLSPPKSVKGTLRFEVEVG